MNCLISTDNKVHEITAGQHSLTSRRLFGMTLQRFLSSGGVRIMQHRNTICIESGRYPAEPVERLLLDLVRQANAGTLVTCFAGHYDSQTGFITARHLRKVLGRLTDRDK